jgi:predicted permease
VSSLVQDVRFALRQLARQPAFAAVAILTIGVGIGGTVLIFSIVNALLLRPLPVAAPEELVVVNEQREGFANITNGYSAFSQERYEDYRDATREIFTGLAAHRDWQMSVRFGEQAEVVDGIVTSSNYFEVLGLRPVVGRFFSEVDGRDPVMVLSYRQWQQTFGGDPGVLGRTVQLNSRPFTVIGVAPQGFNGVSIGGQPGLWISIPAFAAVMAEGTGGVAPTIWTVVFGRLAPGMSVANAEAALAVTAPRIPLESPAGRVAGVSLPRLTGLPNFEGGEVVGFVGMLFATAGLVLLVASANVAGMLLARSHARRREIGIREAIGAGRGRLMRQLLTESLLLFVLGGAVGIILARWASGLLLALQPPMETVVLDLSLDGRVLSFALLLSLFTGVVFGLLPASRAARPDVLSALKEGAAPGAARMRMRGAFVVGQFAISVVLLVAAGLFIRTLQTTYSSDLGLDHAGVAVASVNLTPHGYDRARGEVLFSELIDRVAARPEIESAALTVFAPLSMNQVVHELNIPSPEGGEDRSITASYGVVGPGFFETLGIPLVAGRGILPSDGASRAPVGVINQTMAERLWPNENPIGKVVRGFGAEIEIVGVARDGRYLSATQT